MLDLQAAIRDQTVRDALNALGNDIRFDGVSEKGGNGYVFFGLHSVLQRRVAVKFYYYQQDSHDEVRLLAGLRHENVLPIQEAHTVGANWAYFVTAEMKVGDIDDFLLRQPPSIHQAISITRQILSGLSQLHRSQLVHRDLKAANILVDENDRPVIADFGSVKRVPDGHAWVNGSRHAALYRPPESWNEDRFSFPSDLYQVGMVAYQLLGGYLPYDEISWLSDREHKQFQALPGPFERSEYVDRILATRASRGRLLDWETVHPVVPGSLLRVLRKATNPDPQRRFQTTAEFLLALHELGYIPNWAAEQDTYVLLNHGGRDYRIVPAGDCYRCEKKNTASLNWRADNSIGAGTKQEVIRTLRDRLQV